MKIVPSIGLIAASLVAATVASPSFAQGPGPGPCTSSGNSAVGVEGPAMNGGQLMAGVGNCRHRHARWRDSYGYYRAPARTVYDRDYYDRGYDGPGVTIGVGPDRW
ncbi:hypothetical protein [Bradyrhizobium guangdongense]|nr:hypothetical protein [Bradyrhizobium guangdongense]